MIDQRLARRLQGLRLTLIGHSQSRFGDGSHDTHRFRERVDDDAIHLPSSARKRRRGQPAVVPATTDRRRVNNDDSRLQNPQALSHPSHCVALTDAYAVQLIQHRRRRVERQSVDLRGSVASAARLADD